MLYGKVIADFPVYTDKFVTIKAGTKVCMECTNGANGEWKVASKDAYWTMNSDRMRRNIKVA